MRIQKVDLEQMLYARERRAAIQNEMLGRPDGNCLVCLTLNIAGDIKRTPMTRMLFDRGAAEFDSLGLNVSDCLVIDEATGSEAFWQLGEDEDPEQIKRQLEAVEDSFAAARLFDFDVLVREQKNTASGLFTAGGIRKLSRAVSRRCLICGRPAAECARSHSHGLEAVRAATDELLMEFCAKALADTAYHSLLDELYTTPKPGLVDLANCGAHTDMDIPLFEKSAESLLPYFYDAAMMGMNGCSMKELRVRGLKAEKEMFHVTGGVNTHKGMIYSMGLLLAGMGMVLRFPEGTPVVSPGDADETIADAAVRHAAELARADAEQVLEESLADPKTNGGKVLKAYGAKGSMGEASAGFPDAVYCASRLRYYTGGSALENAGVLAFCDSMARLEDTNLLYRGGREGLDFARREASRIAAIQDFGERIAELEKLDADMIKRNLSPGGSADMLALAYLLERWRMLLKTDN